MTHLMHKTVRNRKAKNEISLQVCIFPCWKLAIKGKVLRPICNIATKAMKYSRNNLYECGVALWTCLCHTCHLDCNHLISKSQDFGRDPNVLKHGHSNVTLYMATRKQRQLTSARPISNVLHVRLNAF